MQPPQVRGLAAMLWVLRFFRDPVGTIIKAHERFGPATVIGPLLPWRSKKRKYILALGADFNRIVFGDPGAFRTTGQARSGPPDSPLRRLRNGLTAMNGPRHKQMRQFIAPFFSKKAIDDYRVNLVDTVDQILAQWPTGKTVDMAALFHHLMLRLSASTLFARENPARLDALGAMLHDVIQRNLSPRVQLFPFDIAGTPYRKLLHKVTGVEHLLLEIFAERRANPVHEGGDMVDHLIHACDGENTAMTDADLLGQTAVLFGASYETQSKAMTWSALLLAQHPNVQRRLLDELDSVLGGRPPTMKQLDDLPYLEAVINESLRILPPVPYTLRRSQVAMDMLGIPVQPGDWIVLSHFISHRCPKLYPEPRRFLPQRWFCIKPNQYEFLPFSAGPRWCIGKSLAMNMMKLTLAMIMQRFRWQVRPGARIDRLVRVTMSARRGLPMVLEPQDRRFRAVHITGNVANLVDWTDANNSVLARAG